MDRPERRVQRPPAGIGDAAFRRVADRAIPSAASTLPRAIMSVEKLAGSGGAIGAMAPRMGSASVAMPIAPAKAAPAMASHGLRVCSFTGRGGVSPASAARARA